MSDCPRQLLPLTALVVSIAVIAHSATRYAIAYVAAPREALAFLDAVDSSVLENESYDKDLAKLQRMEDKVRLGRLLRDLQRGGDSLRQDLSSMMVGEVEGGHVRLRISARIFWAGKRIELEDKIRSLDLLRMRFLVVHMGIVSGMATEAVAKQEASITEKVMMRTAPPLAPIPLPPVPPPLPRALTEIKRPRTPMRSMSMQQIGHHNSVEGEFRLGWAGVVQELQMSPILLRRHALIEMAMEQET
ncbi:hypothetical protein OQA88_10492 [Cercophora sp. LCS_1]